MQLSTPDAMSPSKSVPALPSSDVPAQKPSELAEPPSQTVTREGKAPFQPRTCEASPNQIQKLN